MAPLSSLQIPTVTQADLLEFHRANFGRPFTGQSLLSQNVQYQYQHQYAQSSYAQAGSGEGDLNKEGEYYAAEEDEEDDGLGYYADGVKRTLTDEQIAIFRHSEIQALLRERRLVREGQEEETSPAITLPIEPLNTQITSIAMGNHPDGSTVGKESGEFDNEIQKFHESDGIGQRKDSDRANKYEEEEEEEEKEYARFLRAERAEFQRTAAARRNGERMLYDADDRTISTRRRVRELDDVVQTSTDTLMYDDGEEKPAPDTTKSSNPDKMKEDEYVRPGSLARHGRKIWWPDIRPAG